MTYPDHDRYSDPEEITPATENEITPETAEGISDRLEIIPDTGEPSPLQGEFAPLVSEEAPEGPPERRTSDEMIETMFNSATGSGDSSRSLAEDMVPESKEPSDSFPEGADPERKEPPDSLPEGADPESRCPEVSDNSGEEDFSAYSD